MKNFRFNLAGLTVLVMFIGACASKHPSPAVSNPQNPPSVTKSSSVPIPKNSPTISPGPLLTNPVPVIPPQPTNLPTTSPAAVVISSTNAPATKPETNLQTQYEKYQQGKISKGEMMRAVWETGNRTPQSLYGKVVDQYGDPVVGAEVTGSIELIQGFDVGEKFELHKTQTDGNGLFQFTDLKGSRLDAAVTKNGYEIDYRGARTGPIAPQTSPADRQTFTLWKLKGAEPMSHLEIDSRVPYDGTSVVFNLMTGKKDANGDLKITLLRSPLQIQRGRDRFNWTVRIEMPGGGLLPERDLYPNWAPDNGYQPAFEASVKATDIPWNRSLKQRFYFKNAKGQYGRLFINLAADSMRPDTGVNIQAWINPAGSRNLEWDPAKQIH